MKDIREATRHYGPRLFWLAVVTFFFVVNWHNVWEGTWLAAF